MAEAPSYPPLTGPSRKEAGRICELHAGRLSRLYKSICFAQPLGYK